MSEDLREIAALIATADVGDGDRVLDILDRVYKMLTDLEHRVKQVENGLAEDGRP